MRLELIDDAAIAAHRAIEALQIAVDDENQVVEFFAGGEGEGADRFRLVHFAVAEKPPDLASFGVEQFAVLQIAHETRLVNRVDRADAHRAGGELPEIRHQPGVRIGAQARPIDLLPIIGELLFRQMAFEKGARINAGRGVRLEVNEIAAVVGNIVGTGRAEEMIEADFEQIGCRGEAGDMPAQFAVGAIGAHHHRQRIPAHV